MSANMLADIPGEKNHPMRYRLRNNSTIYVVVIYPCQQRHVTLANEILSFGSEDKQSRELLTTNLDAVDLGYFNGQDQRPGFINHTMGCTKEYPHQKIHHAIQPPSNWNVSRVYQGPIVWTGMFSQQGEPWHARALSIIEALQKQSKRSNSASVYGRSYIATALEGAECSSNDNQKVATCEANPNHAVYSNGHRCVGSHGAMSDLVEFDLVESLAGLL